MTDAGQSSISFAEFEIDMAGRRLLNRSGPVPLNARAFDLLVFLAENSGQIVSKEQILERVWGGKFVEESNIVVQISHLRKALGETRNTPRFLINVPGKGYKFNLDKPADAAFGAAPALTIAGKDQIKANANHSSRHGARGLWLAAAALAIAAIVTASIFYLSRHLAVDAKQIGYTKITVSGQITSAAISADGNFAVFSQKEAEGESLWLRQIKTGSQTPIVSVQPIEYVGLTISPDAQFVFASTFTWNEIDSKVLRIPIIGGVAEQIPNVTTGVAITFSPDQKRFAFTASNNREHQTLLGVSDVDGSNVRYVLTAKQESRYIPNFRSSPAAWSPDGKSVALGVRETSDGVTTATILSVDPDSGAEKYLVDHRWSYIDHLAWLDANRLAFIGSEDEGLRDQVWIVDTSTGDIRRITNNLRRYSWLSASASGLLTVQIDAVTSLRVAIYRHDTESLDPREVYNASEYLDEMDWDGRGRIVYTSTASGRREIWRMNANGSEKTQLTSGANAAFGIAVSPVDGSIVFAANREKRRGLWLADADGQNPRRISDGADIGPDVSNDGHIVFHRGLGQSDGVYITSQVEGTPRLLQEKCYFPAISPDGRQTACYFMDWESRKWQIALISTDTGESIRTLRPPIPIYERQIRFHPSGNYITQIFSSGENLHLLMLPVDGGEARVIDGLGKGTSNLPQWSADGTQLLYPVMLETQDAVMLTGF